MLVWIVLLSLAGFLLYKYATKYSHYFDERGIEYLKPVFLIGSNWPIMFKKESMPDFFKRNYLEHSDKKIVGFFDGRKPHYLISSPELVKQICIKDFDSFVDHRSIVDKDVDDLFAKVLIMLKGEKWKNMRATLSPAFTGSKMRLMHGLIKKCTCSAMWTLDNQIDDKKTFEMKEFFTNFAVDVIATCAFALEVDSFKNPDNEFKKVALNTSNPNGFLLALKIIGITYFPKLMKMMKIGFLEKSVAEFFRSTITETIRYREANNIVRPDMIHLLMEAKKGNLKHSIDEEKTNDGISAVEESEVGRKVSKNELSDDDITAQCLLFFLAGFDTMSHALSFAAYELAVNIEVQEKLRSEIIEMEKTCGQDLNYDQVQKMNYMDQFVSEVLRKWPPGFVTERICNKDFTVELDDGKMVKIEKDQIVIMPVYGFHHNPKFFPNPDQFSPDRWNEENRKNQNFSAYMPFGIGPRNCIGSRFALMEIKTVLYYLLLNYQLNVCSKTQIPLKFLKSMVRLRAEKDIWIELQKIK